ncbi:MAG: hypothetical protein GXO48_07110, partial [Chlorobi bacterium]|nr:hypothetical protein [Chlorobiota bacterium]
MRTLFVALAFIVGLRSVQAQENVWNEINQRIVDLYSAGNYEDAIYIARQNRRLMDQAPTPIKIVFYNNLAGSFLEADLVDSAIFYYSKAVELAQKDTAKLITSLINLREAYATVPNFHKALEINSEAL